MVAAQQEIPIVELEPEEGSVCPDHALEIARQEIRTKCFEYSPRRNRQYLHVWRHNWRRVIYLNMSDSSSECPSGWQLTSLSKRTCGRVSGGRACDSATFPFTGAPYTRVCGRIVAYQISRPDAFQAYHLDQVTTIDGAYVAGVNLTHGNPRQHIWTFANSVTEDEPGNIFWFSRCLSMRYYLRCRRPSICG